MKTKPLNKSKVLVSLLLTLGIIGANAFAQNTIQDSAEAIGSVVVGFCNLKEGQKVVNEKELSIVTKPLQKSELCFTLTNISDKEINFGVNFVDGMYNNMNNKTCDLEEEKSMLGQYISNYEKSVTIPAFGSVEIRPTLQLSAERIGKILGCLTLRPREIVDKENTVIQGGTKIIPRRGVVIEVFSQGRIKTLLQITSDIIQKYGVPHYMDEFYGIFEDAEHNYKIMMGLVNKGAVGETVNIKGYVVDKFGNKTEFEPLEKKVSAGRSDIAEFQVKIPWYKLRYKVYLTVEHTPDVTDIPKEYIDGYTDTQVVNVDGEFFVFPRWQMLGAVILAIAAIFVTKRIVSKVSKK